MDDFEDPQWLRASVFFLVTGVASLGSSGLFLAVIDRYSLGLAVALGAVVFAGLCRASRPLFPQQGRPSEAASICAVVAVVAIVAITAWNVSNSAQHVLMNRDGGTYLNAGKWLSGHGSLEVHPFVGPLDHNSNVGVTSAGMNLRNDHLDFTFAHMVPVLLAEAQGLGGDGFMYALVPFLGGIALLAFYVLARRIVRYPIAALGATLCLGLLIPQVSFSRDSTTEIAVQVLLFGGVWLLCDARTFRHRGAAFTAGLFLGLVQATHIDGLAFLIGLPFICLAVWWHADAEDRRRVVHSIASCGGGALIGVLLGFSDLQFRSPAYLRGLRADVERLTGTLIVAIVVAAVLAVWLGNRDRDRVELPERFHRARESAAFFGAEVVLIGGFGVWLVRPLVDTAHGSLNNVVAAVQAINQLAVDGTRRCYEHAMGWASWYLGPITLTLAIVAAALATRAFVRGELRLPIQMVALILGPAAVLYLWRPSTVPDQIWAARRFLPAVFPILVVATFALLCYLAGSEHRGWTELRRLGVLVLGVATVAYPVYNILNLGRMTNERRFPPVVEDVCRMVGHTGAVIVPQESAGTLWLYGLQTIRSYCDVPVGHAYSGRPSPRIASVPSGKLVPAELRKLALDWATHGRRLYLVASAPGTIKKLFPGAKVQLTRTVTNRFLLEQTLDNYPHEYESETFALAVARVPLPLG